ncbi:transcriptional regulator [Brachybacterium vulturis]|uniref:Transcriptional regulator n=1 Tax=Brachybacterium vulturis TaxID=2017484 RepID=A0A291GJA0_9MICO|nr:ROK family protein [Brachybacterium vulturis]ATG50593.1 transcriptional regulator [Brachybacterium vulturis]
MATALSHPSAVRLANARDCVVVLREAAAALSLAELASATGLSRPTVEAVLEDLRATGLVAPAPAATPGGAGRPARRFGFDASAATVAAFDIGTSTVRCLVSDAAGRVLARGSAPATGSDPLAPLTQALHETRTTPTAVGVAVPGILGPDGRITRSLAVPDLEGLDLGVMLADRLGCPVAVENDIKLAALAEHHLAPPAHSIVLLQLGHRISVAVVVGGEILQGAHRLAGELGSQRGMRWTDSSVRGRLTWSTGDDGRRLLERAAAGDAAAQAEVEEFCTQIAPRLATVLLTVDPERVVVGGGLSRAGETLLAPLRRAVGRLLMTEHAPELVPARLTTDGALIGALGLGFAHGSSQITGIPEVPAPWHRLHATLS